MIQHQKSLLQDVLRNNRHMKLNIRCKGLFEQVVDEALIQSQYNLPATRFNIHNEEELTQAIEDSVKQILLQIEQLEGSRSNLVFKKIISIEIHYDTYAPTRAEYIH